MKNTILFLLLFTILLPACRKTHQTAGNTASLPGTWTLVETLMDPGDGSGTWKPAQSPLVLLFTNDGQIQGNAFPQARQYAVLNDTTIKFVYTDGTFIIYNYTVSGSSLLLSGGGCIEACGLKFSKSSSTSL
jgi:hypothetical protein